MLTNAFRTQSLDVLFLLRNNLFQVVAVQLCLLTVAPLRTRESRRQLRMLKQQDKSLFSLFL